MSFGGIGPLVMVLDLVTLLAIATMVGLWRREYGGIAGDQAILTFFGLGLLSAIFFISSSRNKGLYEPNNLLSFEHQLIKTTQVWLTVVLLVLVIAFIGQITAGVSRGSLLTFVALAYPSLLAQRALVRGIFRSALAEGTLRGPQIAVLTIGNPSHRSLAVTKLHRFGYQAVEHRHVPLASTADDGRAENRKVAISRVLASLRGTEAKEVFIVADWHDLVEFGDPVDLFMHTPLPVRMLLEPRTVKVLRSRCAMMGRFGVLDLKHAPLTSEQQWSKRMLDILVSSIALILIHPVLVLAAIAIKLDSPGPVLFRQRRNGFNGRTFRIFKFRSMRTQEDGPNVLQASRQDPRVTRVGYWLRRTSIDELPQLLNVLLGDMSLVGPRPHALAHDDQYGALIGRYAHRHHMKPGITGLAQVSGYRGETQTVELMERRVELDIHYIASWSLWQDVVIIVRTGLMLVMKPNAY